MASFSREATLWKNLQENLPGGLIEHLKIFHRIILAIDQEIELLDGKISCQNQEQPKPKGMGAATLAVIENEMVDWARFGSWRKVGSYSGLVGGVSGSGFAFADGARQLAPLTRFETMLRRTTWKSSLPIGNASLG